MCELCCLSDSKDGFIITICNTCGIPLICLREHRADFTNEEVDKINKLFPNREIRWEQRSIKNHAHCHLL